MKIPRWINPGTRPLVGKALPYETLTVKVNGTTSDTAVATADGSWTYTLGSAPTFGSTVTTVATSGAVFTVSSNRQIIVAPVNTAAPVITRASPPQVGQTMAARAARRSRTRRTY